MPIEKETETDAPKGGGRKQQDDDGDDDDEGKNAARGNCSTTLRNVHRHKGVFVGIRR